MRILNLDGRLALDSPDGAVDVAAASDGRFGTDPQAVYDTWGAFTDWAGAADVGAGSPLDVRRLGPPVPAPRQVFAVALNYAEHAAEAAFAEPEAPLVFTKFPTCLAGPHTRVALPTAMVDWEVELVVVIGARASWVDAEHAWEHVAGLTVGQDLSARDVQRAGPSPQFSLGKSFAGFGPIGPSVVTVDELDLDALELECRLNGDVVQRAHASDMLFSVPELIAYLSRICPLLPGDLLFTGTPQGVGARRDPPRYLRPGDVLTSRVTGIGEITQEFTASDSRLTSLIARRPAQTAPRF